VDEFHDVADARVASDSTIGRLTNGALNLQWSLNVDWFNPYQNKQAGKVYSTGAMSMICLDLPPSLRYQAENIYLAGILPGPHEPSLDEINHFLRPLVDELVDSWKYKHHLTRTALYLQGCTVQSQVSLLVSDLPASRKVSGHAGHSASQFCGLCLLQKSDINEIDPNKWGRWTYQSHLEAALAWKNAESKKKQKSLYKSNGIRWSELLRLPYWDPTRHVVVDPMHNLFLNLIQHHFRILLELDSADGGTSTPPTPKMLERARKSLEHATSSSLRQHKQATLAQLCQELNIPIPMSAGKVKKATLISLLLVSCFISEYVSIFIEQVFRQTQKQFIALLCMMRDMHLNLN